MRIGCGIEKSHGRNIGNGNDHRLSADQTRFQQSSKERFAHAGLFLLLAVQALHAASRANKKEAVSDLFFLELDFAF